MPNLFTGIWMRISQPHAQTNLFNKQTPMYFLFYHLTSIMGKAETTHLEAVRKHTKGYVSRISRVTRSHLQPETIQSSLADKGRVGPRISSYLSYSSLINVIIQKHVDALSIQMPSHRCTAMLPTRRQSPSFCHTHIKNTPIGLSILSAKTLTSRQARRLNLYK